MKREKEGENKFKVKWSLSTQIIMVIDVDKNVTRGKRTLSTKTFCVLLIFVVDSSFEGSKCQFYGREGREQLETSSADFIVNSFRMADIIISSAFLCSENNCKMLKKRFEIEMAFDSFQRRFSHHVRDVSLPVFKQTSSKMFTIVIHNELP